MRVYGWILCHYLCKDDLRWVNFGIISGTICVIVGIIWGVFREFRDYIMPYIGCTGIPGGFRRDSTGFVWDGIRLM